MTAFGRGKYESPEKDITIEIKSVNSRFFDCNVKMPRSLSFLEERIKSYIQKKAISRAKVDVYVTVENRLGSLGSVEIDRAYAESYIDALRELGELYGLRDDISISTVARNSDVFLSKKPEADLEAEWKLILVALDAAISDHTAMREKEGAKALADISEKIEILKSYVSEVETVSRIDTVGYRDKLEARIRAILQDNSVSVDENRLLTECAIWADKIAIDEEIVRLRSHFTAFHEIASAEEPSGRKLDFLMQEMNRETNTIGSKANNSKIAHIVVSMKGELEKIREQIQNVE